MSKALCWLRRDLRLHDHHALSAALKNHPCVDLVFIFDQHILSKLEDKSDQRLSFIIDSLKELESTLVKKNSSIHILYGKPEEEIPKLALKLKITHLYYNRDYEPYAVKRDSLVTKICQAQQIEVQNFKDSVIFEKHEVLTKTQGIYKVFTPYKNRWLEILDLTMPVIPEYKVNLKNLSAFKNKQSILNTDWYSIIGFENITPTLPAGSSQAQKTLKKFKSKISNYHEARNIPSLHGTSSLSPYIRHGNLSIREMLKLGLESKNSGAQTWISELVWRDFYHMILATHPQVETKSFKPDYDKIIWPGSQKNFKAWCEGRTGFPLVDAAMRCLNQTGLMHNRLRMVTASFLCKTLLVDWRKGERYFAKKLLDFDLASNSGGWQWSSSSGCDAQPYFRIFNPYNQSEKFDEDGLFIKNWCPELKNFNSKNIHAPHLTNPMEQALYECIIGQDYPAPIVEYSIQRDLCLKLYSVVKN